MSSNGGLTLNAACRYLAALWKSRRPDFAAVSGDPLVLPALQDLAQLEHHLMRTPELAQLTGEARVREAELRLARSQAGADVQWQVGIRYLRNGGDVGAEPAAWGSRRCGAGS
ncbi:hypothetical protein LPH50_00465 [Xylella taiwanensis]|uniref:Uncharacterized protein n=1 Tax=Xylella taiwanensis TaxID=1444770 RepID=A0ABS8TV95_9GAMM|nr:hypothetical protein [Xylella taiwanensis]MCD8456717.1 hypothetical protein [Xylella taiwanensis]MCD8459124.1 hypothetical protein [Xylella taiwanensis]MCD8464215.1 hypothetical protein [Xylella taiwanensis]MCD8465769.1 hypothetical protein [Xylella taiwanensis]MCD8466672.1 hypothetical protein [Xylella taiwanensis]